jgi:hypothetical protein
VFFGSCGGTAGLKEREAGNGINLQKIQKNCFSDTQLHISHWLIELQNSQLLQWIRI